MFNLLFYCNINPYFFGKVIFEITVDQIAPLIGATFGGVLGPAPLSGHGLRPYPYMGTARQMLFLFLAQYYANRGLSERSWSPEYQDIKIFEIGWKMTELWDLTRCPNMGADAIMALKSALKWAHINIFQWDLFYMISRHTVHCMPVVNENCIAVKTWILWPKNLKKKH